VIGLPIPIPVITCVSISHSPFHSHFLSVLVFQQWLLEHIALGPCASPLWITLRQYRMKTFHSLQMEVQMSGFKVSVKLSPTPLCNLTPGHKVSKTA